jgi:hypothetical protein
MAIYLLQSTHDFDRNSSGRNAVIVSAADETAARAAAIAAQPDGETMCHPSWRVTELTGRALPAWCCRDNVVLAGHAMPSGTVVPETFVPPDLPWPAWTLYVVRSVREHDRSSSRCDAVLVEGLTPEDARAHVLYTSVDIDGEIFVRPTWVVQELAPLLPVWIKNGNLEVR